MLRVLIADDQALFRNAVATVLSADTEIEVVAQASDGQEAIDLCTEEVPDLVLMDVRMPKVDGIEATRQIKAATPTTKIVMLTVSDADDDLFDAIKAGADGYVLKDLDPDDVAQIVKDVAGGSSIVTPRLATRLLGEFKTMAKKSDLAPRLSHRENEILEGIVAGKTNRGIAHQYGIAENTVKNHVRNILEKLHLGSRTEAAVWAVREGIVPDPKLD